MYFFTVLKTGSSRSRCQQAWCLGKAPCLNSRCLSPLCWFKWPFHCSCAWGVSKLSDVSSNKDTNLIGSQCYPTTSFNFSYFCKGPISKQLYWGFGFQNMNRGEDDKHLIHNKYWEIISLEKKTQVYWRGFLVSRVSCVFLFVLDFLAWNMKLDERNEKKYNSTLGKVPVMCWQKSFIFKINSPNAKQKIELANRKGFVRTLQLWRYE